MSRSPSRPSYTESEKAAALAIFSRMRESGVSVRDAVIATGVSRGTIFRWMAEMDQPAAGAAKAAEEVKIGRPRGYELDAEEIRVLRGLRLLRRSLNLAIEEFLRNEACRPETAAWINGILDTAAANGRAPSWPHSLRKAVFVSEEESAAFRGKRALGKYAPTVTRGAYWLDAQGNQVPLHPHDIWESDDMSVNEPYRHIDPVTGEVRIGRQVLVTACRMSAAILGLTLVARDRDAYRASDLLDHILDLVDLFGLPRLWRIERGIWESRVIDGIPLDDSKARSLGYVGNRWEGRKIGGLGSLMRIEHMYSSNGKGGIEGTFNHAQNLIAHESLHIGRERGEFEGAARQLRRAQNGIVAAQEKFWTANECAEALLAMADRFNTQPKSRSMYGGARLVPADLLRRDALPKRELPASERWRFHPEKMLAVVRRGLIEVTVEGVKHSFPAYGDGIHLDHGHRVLIAFHPEHPERGCTVVEAEFGPRNRESRPIGEPLFTTLPLELRPQWSESADASLTGGEHPAKRWRGQVWREFRAIDPLARGGEAAMPAQKSYISDGRGRHISMERGFDRQLTEAEMSASEMEGLRGAPEFSLSESSACERLPKAVAATRDTCPSVPTRSDLEEMEDEALQFL